MARIARAVAPGKPHHVTQRQQTFFNDRDYQAYLELNPVRAGVVKKPSDWRWSGAGPHMKGKNDIRVKTQTLPDMVNRSWKRFLGFDDKVAEMALFRKHE